MSASIVAPLFDSAARIMSLLGSITPQDINLAVDQLLRLDQESADPITLFISCQACGVVEALKIIDTYGLLQSPLTAVGLGYIEGAGTLILASAQQRVLYPSTIVSTAGLWDLPHLHRSGNREIGLHREPDAETQLRDHLRVRLEEMINSTHGKIPAFLGDPQARPQLLNSRACLRAGIADAIIRGPKRNLTQPQTSHLPNVKNIQHPSL